ncbi:protein CROWDED NUCLEI 1 [Pistacia vera]|uniref:protein CROWDED NUCLEI 1 n=1 Tax=Pistacia vera TaxID=55513 RepID=UPI0012630275|nr:protein CROWDED NUCLEI 1 [Pistacia vera]
MFTPQRKVWSGWSLTPRTEKNGTGSGSNGQNLNPSSVDGTVGKGKGVAFVEPVTPQNGVGPGQEMESLAEKISRLENELFEYQYNMGLLLIEKKEWSSKYEELRQVFEDARDALKREQAAHLIAITDVEKREENLRKALGVEKQCVVDLEKALRDMRSEIAEIKFTADSKLAEANALVTSIEEKSLEVDVKLRAADAKLAEVSRKSSEIERKSKEVESRESALRMERLSFIAEREAHETTFSQQREDLREWERKLQEGEERVAKGQTIVNQREERANEKDAIFKQKEKDLEEAQKNIDAMNLALKRKEDDINSRLANLSLKEKEYDATRKNLEVKEDELLKLEEKLKAREMLETEKLLEEHQASLDAKQREFDLEIEQKRKSVDDDLKSKVIEVEKKENEINHKEEKIAKRELALDKKLEKFKEKEKDFESKVKALKDREKTIRSEEKNLETEKKQLLADKEGFLSLKAELERLKVENEQELLKIHEARDQLKVSEEERAECLQLQSELKEEIENCRLRQELLLKETEDLKQQKESFEREWEELDEKRAAVEEELKKINGQKEKLDKERHSEEERLRKEKQVAEDYIKRELEALEVSKESFKASMEHERSVIMEKAESDRRQLLRDFELRKRELETNMQNRQEELEKDLQEKEKLFEEEKERELSNINYLRDVARKEMEEMKLERVKLEKEKQENEAHRKHFDEEKVGIRKDIDMLVDLTETLKGQREQLVQERDHFLTFVEKHKSCKNCAEITSEYKFSDLVQEIVSADVPPLPSLANDYVNEGVHGIATESKNNENSPNVGSGSPVSAGTMSWLRKCTSKIFKFSPTKMIDHTAVQELTEDATPSGGQFCVEEPSNMLGCTSNEPELSFAIVNDSYDVPRVQSETSTRGGEVGQDKMVDDQSNINGKVTEVEEDSQPIDHGRQPRRRGRPRVSRTRSVKAVVQDAKAILGEGFNSDEIEHPNGNTEDSGHEITESRGESIHADKGTSRNARKRNRAKTSQTTLSEHDGGDSEGQSGSVVAGQHKKRRQKVSSAVQTPVGTRYNLRRPKTGVTGAAARTTSEPKKGREEGSEAVGGAQEDEISCCRVVPARSVEVVSEYGKSMHLERCGEGDASKNLVENMALSEEVSGTPEEVGEYGNVIECKSESQREGGGVGLDSEEEDGEEYEHPGEASIGKKLWTFFTT